MLRLAAPSVRSARCSVRIGPVPSASSAPSDDSSTTCGIALLRMASAKASITGTWAASMSFES